MLEIMKLIPPAGRSKLMWCCEPDLSMSNSVASIKSNLLLNHKLDLTLILITCLNSFWN